MGVLVAGRAVAQIPDRDKVVRTDGTQELAHIRTSPDAAIARATLRRSGNADAIADLNTTHFRTDGFNHADAAVALNHRQIIHAARAGRGGEYRRRRRRACGLRLTQYS